MTIKETIQSLCADVDGKLIEDFFARMDEDYFATFSPQEVATHIHMASALDAEHRIDARIRARGPESDGEYDIVIVGFDYPSEFSMFCGLLSSFGLDIRNGDIYSFGRTPERRSMPRKIVDVFRVVPRRGETFDEARQDEFAQELHTLAQILASGAVDQARERLNRFLTERIEKMNESLTGLLSPIQIHFDNQLSPAWTVMEVHSENAFGFVYAVSNALAMQGVYIHKVKIRSLDGHVEDQFFISDLWGRKIEQSRDQERLRIAVTLIKQFTRFLPEAPDPAKAMRHFDQFLGKIAEERFPDHIVSFFAGQDGMSLLARLLGSSDFLWDDFLGIHFKNLLPVLENLAKTELRPGREHKASLRSDLFGRLARTSTFEEKRNSLNEFKDYQLFLIDSKHILDSRVTLSVFSSALTDLAEVVLDEATSICHEHLGKQVPGTFTICGLGKFGGCEMGYASDLELLFIHNSQEPAGNIFFESLARLVVDFIEARKSGIFHIDLRLRPHGDAGAWSIPFEEFTRYYSAAGQAAPFERQALTKLRWAAGNEELGRRVEAHRDSFTYSGAPWDWRNALHLRQRQIRELVRPGLVNVKYGPGGIIDIEYTVQYLQLLNGAQHPELRVPNTLDALDSLHRLQIVGQTEYDVLRSSYLFLRGVIDALRIVRGDSSDLVLPDPHSEEFKSLARTLGYCEQDRGVAAANLSDNLGGCMKAANEEFLKLFPL